MVLKVVPKIIYASRTHSQISQVVRELKRTGYQYVTMQCNLLTVYQPIALLCFALLCVVLRCAE
jgi:hypothetical protein